MSNRDPVATPMRIIERPFDVRRWKFAPGCGPDPRDLARSSPTPAPREVPLTLRVPPGSTITITVPAA